MKCADGCEPNVSSGSLNRGAALLAIGSLLLSVSLLARGFSIKHHAGLTFWPTVMLVSALLVVVSGLMIRLTSLCLLGVFFATAVLVSEYLGLRTETGFGFGPMAALLVLVLITVAGVLIRRSPRPVFRTSERRQQAADDSSRRA